MKQVSLIAASKDKIVLICLVLFSLCCSVNPKKLQTENPFLIVDFQDYFDSDTVGLKLNNCILFTGKYVTTKPPVGFADIRVSILKERNKYKVHYSDKVIICRSNDMVPKLTVQLNGSEHEFFIDLAKGMYIGFSKKNDKELYFLQNPAPFVYE